MDRRLDPGDCGLKRKNCCLHSDGIRQDSGTGHGRNKIRKEEILRCLVKILTEGMPWVLVWACGLCDVWTVYGFGRD